MIYVIDVGLVWYLVVIILLRIENDFVVSVLQREMLLLQFSYRTTLNMYPETMTFMLEMARFQTVNEGIKRYNSAEHMLPDQMHDKYV